MKKSTFTLLFFILILGNIAAQFDMTAEIRPRFESRNGYKSLLNTDQKGTNFISQRSRLTLKYKMDNIKLGMSLQNVRVWGDVGTLASRDINSAFHEAWAELMISEAWSAKMGRQEIVYDDHRIFGDVGWTQQARSHDALLFKYIPNDNHRLDIGFALNADNRGNVDVLYSNVAGYKTFQYGWYHGKFNNLEMSFLLLNTGIEYNDANNEKQLNYMQTIGPRFTYKNGRFNAVATTYIQTGKVKGNTVNATYYAGDLGYKVHKNVKVGVGMEYLSGKDQSDTESDVRSFAPLFGTNHKFNGWMDYFYVGNYFGSVGLVDIYFPLVYSKNKFSAKLIPHLFSTAADVYNGTTKMDRNLGTEIDLTLGYKVSKGVKINGGISKMLATETMEVIKGGDKTEANNWAWLMVTIKPQLFSNAKK